MQKEKLLANIEAEINILSALLYNPRSVKRVMDTLQPEHFYRDKHALVYRMILSLHNQGRRCDVDNVWDEIERQDATEKLGITRLDLTDMSNSWVSGSNVEDYAAIVIRKATMRHLALASAEIAASAYAEDEDALEKAEKLIYEIATGVNCDSVPTLAQALDEYMIDLEQRISDRALGIAHGIPMGLTDVDKTIGGLQPGTLNTLAALTGFGKCLPSWTLIDDPITGERITLEECVRRKMPMIHGMSEEGKVRVTPISDWIDSGVKQCYRVRTRLGRMVEVTGIHPFLTVNGWEPLYDLGVGDHIAVPTKVECFGSDESWSLEEVRLLGYLIAEGGLTDNSPEFTNTDPIIINDFKQIINNHFPELAIRQYKVTYVVARQGRGGHLKNPLTEWLRKLGIWGKLANDKFFPECVWKWSKGHLAEFIRVIMSCDGSIFMNKQVNYPLVEFCVSSKRLAEDMNHAFTRFGIISKIHQKTERAWCVAITSAESIKRYQDEIGWIGEKATRFDSHIYELTLRGSNNGHAPKEIWKQITDATSSCGISISEMLRRAGEKAPYNIQPKRSVPRYRLAAFAEVLGNKKMQRIASPDIYWDEIVSIEPIGAHQVYDLTVPDGSNFIAQDVFVHNTAFALNVAVNVMQHAKRVLFFSLEMRRNELVQRILAMEACVDQTLLRDAEIDETTLRALKARAKALRECDLNIDDQTFLLSGIKSKARQMHARKPLDLLVIDYLQMVQTTPDGRAKHETRAEEIAKLSREMKRLACELNIPVLVLAQLNREVDKRQTKEPQLSDINESGGIGRDSDIVMFIYATEEEMEKRRNCEIHQVTLKVAKNRNGRIGEVNLLFSPRITKFKNLEVEGMYE